MRRLLLPVLALALIAAAPAAAKPGHGETTLTWLSAPDGTRAGGTWDARFRLEPEGPVEPRVVVRDNIRGAEHHYLAVPQGDGVFAVEVPFPEAGTFAIGATGFDQTDRARVAELGPPVVIDEAADAAAGGGSRWWLWLLPLLLAPLAWIAWTTSTASRSSSTTRTRATGASSTTRTSSSRTPTPSAGTSSRSS